MTESVETKSPLKTSAHVVKIIASYVPEAIIATILIFPFMAQPAYAYVDPSVMTYTIQALAGVAVALSAVLGVVLRKSRRKLFTLFNIDENAHKEVEPAIHRVFDGKLVDEAKKGTHGQDSQEVTVPCGAWNKDETRQPDSAPRSNKKRYTGASRGAIEESPRWRVRFAYALLAAALLSFTLFIVAPFEIVAANSASLLFDLADVGWCLVAFALIIALAIALPLSAFRQRGFTVALLLVIASALGCYIQALFLNQELPTADGVSVIWENYALITIISCVIWFLILALAIFLGHRFGKKARAIGSAIAIALIIVQGAGVASVLVTPLTKSAVNPLKIECTEDSLFNLSEKDNVVVFVLDTFDTADMNQILTEHPDVLNPFENFTFFENTAGSMIPTRYAVPFLVTGEVPKTDQSFEEFYADRYGRSSFLTDIHDAGYSIGLYSDSLDTDYILPSEQEAASQTVNLHPLNDKQIDVLGSISILTKCALYRDMPWLVKPWFWYYTDEINNEMSAEDSECESSIVYRTNDAAYHKKLTESGLSLVDDGSNGAFRFIHLLGAHPPYTMNEQGESVGEGNSSFEKQAQGSLKIVGDYIEQMKQLGIYDSSTIVVTADHGYWYSTSDELWGATSPIMLVKPAASSEDRRPVTTSDMPVSHLDFQATIISALGGDSAKYGETVFDINNPNRKRLYYMTTSNGRHDTGIKELEITGNVLDFSTWHPTGNEWPITPSEN